MAATGNKQGGASLFDAASGPFRVSNRYSDVAVRYFEDLFEHSFFFFFSFFFLSKKLF